MNEIVWPCQSVASTLASRVASFDWPGSRRLNAHVGRLITPSNDVPDFMGFFL